MQLICTLHSDNAKEWRSNTELFRIIETFSISISSTLLAILLHYSVSALQTVVECDSQMREKEFTD